MALGSTNSNMVYGPLYILKPVSKDANKQDVPAHFKVQKKTGNVYEEQPSVTQVSGNIVRVDVKSREFKDVVTKSVNLVLRDGDETYIVELRSNIAGRSLFNALLSLENTENVSISFYNNKKNNYPQFSLRQNDQLVDWKYKISEVPEPIKVVFRGVTQSDFTPTEEFFFEKLIEWSGKYCGKKVSAEEDVPVVESTVAQPPKAKPSRKVVAAAIEATEEDSDDEIPF